MPQVTGRKTRVLGWREDQTIHSLSVSNCMSIAIKHWVFIDLVLLGVILLCILLYREMFSFVLERCTLKYTEVNVTMSVIYIKII